MSLETSRYQLYSALKTARLRWEDTCQHWNDSVRQHFENDFWNPLELTVQAAMSALDKLDQTIGELQRECRGSSE